MKGRTELVAWLPTALTVVLTLTVGLTQLTWANGAVGDVAGLLGEGVQGFQNLLFLIAMALLGAGIAIKFLPTGSHRTKDAAGQLLDNALIIGGLAALGVWLVWVAGLVATTATGMGEAPPQPSGPWTVPSG